MIRYAAALLCCLAATCSQGQSTAPPQVELNKGMLRMSVYLPDAAKGFYKGTRFDWSGVISDLAVGGHHLYRPWFTDVDPSVRDFIYTERGITASANTAMTGPAEEFQEPIGYSTAKAGDTFLKIGVGILRKGDDTPYFFGKHFELVDSGKWTVHSTSSTITFQQTLGKPGDDYAYVYTKTIRLISGNSLVMEHHLKNVGKVALVSPLYDHNFLTVDGADVAAGTTIRVPYELKPTRQPDPKAVSIGPHEAAYLQSIQGKDHVVFGLQGYGSTASDYDFTIEEPAANLAIRMQGDRPLSNASVWSIRTVLAVEPFIAVDAQPGGEFSWTYTYTYLLKQSHL